MRRFLYFLFPLLWSLLPARAVDRSVQQLFVASICIPLMWPLQKLAE